MTRLVIGLGNIGERYIATRHNVGFQVVEQVRQSLQVPFEAATALYDSAVALVEERQIILARPKTYMNRSGEAVLALLEVSSLTPAQMLVVVDDFNLPLGRIRVRPEGSEGGHKGLVSIVESLGTQCFPRMRLGIGPVPEGTDKTRFVLSRFTEPEERSSQKMVAKAAEAAIFALHHSLEEVMSNYNANPA